ncbi:MAG: hypothetical protein L0H70_00100 [Xanthomonadales bacterium]|nr:hypothetical protein [Xanthomonadales bacterium]
MNDSPNWPEWSALSKKNQIKRIAWQIFILAIVYGWIAFQVLIGTAYLGRAGSRTVFHLQTHPIPFCIFMLIEMTFFAAMAFTWLRDPLLKGWQKAGE